MDTLIKENSLIGKTVVFKIINMGSSPVSSVKIKKAYNSMVECSAHNGKVIGSNPIKLIYE